MKIIGIAIFTTFRAIKTVIRGIINKNKGNYFYEEMKKWANELLKIICTNITIKGLDNIDNNEKYIYIANHTNLIDIPILVKALVNDKINFMYRESLQKMPMIGFALKHSPFIPIIRENIRKDSIQKANTILQNAGSVVIFPEGTRSKTGQIANFKRGAFMLADISGKKIIPIAISGVENITPPNKTFKINKSNIIVEIGEPINKLPKERKELLIAIENIRNNIINMKENNDKQLKTNI